MTDDDQLPGLLSTQAQAVVDRAKSLGLTWTLRPATVSTVDTVIYDGDIIPVGVISLIGPGVVNDRVMCLQVPPGGNYIIGRLPGTSLFPTSTVRGKTVSLGDVTLTLGSQAISPVTSLTLTSPGQFMITGTIDFDQTVSAGNNLAIGRLQVDTVAQSEQILFGVTAAGQRATVAQTWFGSLTTGTHTFGLVAVKNLNIGTFIARATHTGFTYQVWQ